jgi:hypothetical protein
MSRQNKVNPDHYKLAGRLSPDDLARERQRHMGSQPDPLRSRNRKPMPPWAAMTKAGAGGNPETDKAAGGATIASRAAADADVIRSRASNEQAAEQPQAKPRRRTVKDVSARRAQKKTARRKMEAGKQRSARSQTVSRPPRRAPKASGAKATPKTRKSGRARGSATRAGSAQRTRKKR